MSTNKATTLAVARAIIANLPPELEEATNELADFIRMQAKRAGSPVGELAIALVGAELAAEQPQ